MKASKAAPMTRATEVPWLKPGAAKTLQERWGWITATGAFTKAKPNVVVGGDSRRVMTGGAVRPGDASWWTIRTPGKMGQGVGTKGERPRQRSQAVCRRRHALQRGAAKRRQRLQDERVSTKQRSQGMGRRVERPRSDVVGLCPIV